MTAVIGIDPGLSGAAVILTGDGIYAHIDMPTLQIERNNKRKRELDAHALSGWIKGYAGVAPHIFVERVGAMPGQGVTSMFQFGKVYGQILGILAAYQIPHTLVHPTVWRKAMHVPKGKDGSRQRASELWPRDAGLFKRVKDNGRADAALIAAWGASQ